MSKIAKEYTVNIRKINGEDHYYISFTDGNRQLQEIEVTHSVYLEISGIENVKESQYKSDKRHIDRDLRSDFEDELFGKLEEIRLSADAVDGAFHEDEKSNQTRIRKAIFELPEKQMKRLLLNYDANLTYEQIAKKESCNYSAAYNSVQAAKGKVKKN